MYNRLLNFLENNNVLTENQFGFRKGRSTDMAIHTLVERFYEAVERDEIMIGIFIDFSRAFDTISHDILLRKLHFYGIRGKPLDWIQNYLSNQKQFVFYNNSQSDTCEISCGVPQGYILGSLLYLLYVNDIVNVSEKISCILFADDTNIFSSGKHLPDVVSTMNTELIVINEWIQSNKLSLNIAKINYMIITDNVITTKEN